MGIFVTFEGGEASGKSTQALRLTKRLDDLHVPCWLTKEPGGTELGKELRRILKYSEEDIDAITETFLFAADRLHHVPVIKERLGQGFVVISDRYSDSTVAYQCYGRNEPNYDYAGTLNLIRQSERSLVPEVTYYLRVEPEDAIERMRNSETHNSRFDKEPPEFHERVLRGFDVQARDYADRFVIIDGMLSMDEIEAIIWNDFEGRLK